MEQVFLWIAGAVLSVLTSVIGWFVRGLAGKLHRQESMITRQEDRITKVSDSLNRHKVHAAETFATKVDVEKGFDRVMHKLDHIDDKLDTKADKVSQ